MTTADQFPPSREPDSTTAGRGIRSSLLALGSAAVLAVYAAGYARTRPAAERLESAESGRRLPVPAPALAAPDTAPVPVAAAAPAVAAKPKAKPVHRETVARDTTTKPAEPVTSAPASVSVASPVSPAVPPAAPAETTKVNTAVAPGDSLHARLNDGRYRGWGYSQHGNMEVEVEIQDGRIVNTYITQCLTAWSCTYVRRLQAQVLDRQSAEVDTVSGATNSSDAFYYATFTALNKARA